MSCNWLLYWLVYIFIDHGSCTHLSHYTHDMCRRGICNMNLICMPLGRKQLLCTSPAKTPRAVEVWTGPECETNKQKEAISS